MSERIPIQCEDCGDSCLEHVDFLAGLPEEKVRGLMALALRKKQKKGSYIFQEDTPVDAIYVIHKGRVKLSTYDGDGREQIVGIFADHDTIWEGAFIDGSVFPYGAMCLTDVDYCKLYLKDFEREIQEPEIALKIIGLLSKKLHDANQRNLLLSIAEPKARIAGFLDHLYRHQAGDLVTLRLDDIAASVRLRPETISRKLQELEREGLIKKVGQSGMQLLNAAGLKALAKP